MGEVLRFRREWEGPVAPPVERPVTKQEMARLCGNRSTKFLDRQIRHHGMPERVPGSQSGCWQWVGGGKVFFPSSVLEWLATEGQRRH